jgi:hypothetical protein
MTTISSETWERINHRALGTALAHVRAALEQYLARTDHASFTAGLPPDAELKRDAERSALDTLCATFRLSPFERDLLTLCAGVELDAGIAALCAEAQGDPQRVSPTFSLALAALPGAHWSALAPDAPLRYWRLIEPAPGGLLTRAPLRIDERVLHYLAGISYLDERLRGLMTPIRAAEALLPSHQALADRIAEVWRRARGGVLPLIQVCGDERATRQAIAAAACAAVGLAVHALNAAVMPPAVADVEALIRLWEREAALGASALLVECDDVDPADTVRAGMLTWLLERTSGAVIVSARDRWRPTQRVTVTIDVQRASSYEQRDAWRTALGAAAERLDGHVDLLISQFNLSAHAIRAASAEALGRVQEYAGHDVARAVWDASRAQARPRLDDLAQRIETSVAWDDLVLPAPQRHLLRDIAAHVRQRARVYETWGFAARSSRGLGISALFAGASGTGKTMAAEVLANELRLDLYRIDLSSVVSKYIGETEKNLRRIFDAAESGGAILLFDEADALFGKRSEVKDSHDRYANIEVSYLLQRMEAYRGLAILTTNLKSALDTAFLRRIRFVVQFPFPDAAQRAEIWRRSFPPGAPTDGLDVEKLARLNVAGGNIRNIALNAAFLAADAGEPIRMVHLLRAARAEYAKLEKQLTEAEVAGWV